MASRCGSTPQYAGLEELYKKFGRDGSVVARFEPKVKPDDAKVVEAITAALKQS